MKVVSCVSAAAFALLGAVSFASAQEAGSEVLEGMYMVPGNDGQMMMMGHDNSNRGVVLKGENGMAPSNCPDGSFYMSGSDTITSCGAKPAKYRFRAAGTTDQTPNNAGLPNNAMTLEPADTGSGSGG